MSATLSAPQAKTKSSTSSVDMLGQLNAINKVMAVIEFELDGTIITANDNFLGALGYSLEEIEGRHHRMFCEPSYTQSNEYRAFWENLARGEFQAGEFKRIGKGGKEIWIQASYNPILDLNGKPVKVVKYASDITAQVNERNAAVKLRGVVDNSDSAFMMIDRNFNITYLNEQTNALLNKYAEVFRSIFPKFDPRNILGQNIDLGKARMVVGHAEVAGTTRVIAQDPQNPEYGTIEMVFSAKPVALRQWIITDNAGGQTVVELGPLVTGLDYPPSTFNIEVELGRRKN